VAKQGEIMKKLLTIALLLGSMFAVSGCASKNAVAMNLYNPKSGESERISGISMVITKDMIEEAKRNRAR